MKKTRMLVALLLVLVFGSTGVLVACSSEDVINPTINASGIPTSGKVGDTITLDATASDNVSAADEIEITYAVTLSGSTVTVTNNQFTASSAGTYSVTITATDKAGNSATTTVEVVVTEVGQEDPDPIVTQLYADNTTLRIGAGYDSADTGISFSAQIAGEGITLSNGETYHSGDLKPTWQELESRLKLKFDDVYQGNKPSAEWTYWEKQLEKVDIVSGTASLLNVAGAAGKVINLADYLDVMPNFKAYLEANPIVRLSITGNVDTGAIYFSPYFDGVNDIERMPLMRIDWLQELLDGEGTFSVTETSDIDTNKNRDIEDASYTAYMPTSGTLNIESLNEDGTKTITITKNYNAYGNIIEKMNAAIEKNGKITGVEAVNMLREYIDETYDNYYGTERSRLFCGYDACWDADELVALLRCVVAIKTDDDGNAVAGLFSRETSSTKRQVDLIRFAGTLFGVRGLESRQDYLYVGTDGLLHDARQEEDTYEAMEKMNEMYAEGLIIMSGTGESKTYLDKDGGFMSYDYNQTQTIYNDTKLNKDGDEGEKYMAIMIPVALWQDGTEGGVYMRFTESWRSVKTDAWAISAAGVEGDSDKLYAALALIDYAYSEAGQILMSYGPDDFIATNSDGSYVTFNFNGKDMPVISDGCRENLTTLAAGNYTNFARQYLGSTLSFVKSQAFEYQCTNDIGKQGAAKISAAIALGTIKHVELALTDNPWYTSVPTVLPTTTTEDQQLGELTELSSSGKFCSSNQQYNVFLQIIVERYEMDATPEITSRDSAITTVSETWRGTTYLSIKNSQWDTLQKYYKAEIDK